jgi:hypothetical protein
MRRPSYGSWALAGWILASAPLETSSEALVLSTYYPSPLGVYQSLITTGIGNPYTDTLLVRDQGHVGVGTSAPTALLHAVGRGGGTVAQVQGRVNDLALSVSADNSGWGSMFQNSAASGAGLYSSAPNLAVYAAATSNGGIAAYDASTGANGYGEIGYGATGVYGYGFSNYGVYGYGPTGVYAYGTGVGVEGTPANAGGTGVYGYVPSFVANGTAVSGYNGGGSGWSGVFNGGQGLFADRILSTTNNIPMAAGYYNTGNGMLYSGVWKPGCPAGYNPMISVQLDNTYLGGNFGTFQSGDWMGAAVWDTGPGWFAIWASVCPAAYPDASGWVAGCQTSPRQASPLGVYYFTYCSANSSFHRFGGCLTGGSC